MTIIFLLLKKKYQLYDRNNNFTLTSNESIDNRRRV